jgi:hypothetical protein
MQHIYTHKGCERCEKTYNDLKLSQFCIKKDVINLSKRSYREATAERGEKDVR